MMHEQAYWEKLARGDRAKLKYGIWSEPAWDSGILSCLERIAPHIQTAKTASQSKAVLEIGCGIGRLAIPLARLLPEWRIIGIDISPTMIAIARQEADVKNVKFFECDGTSIPEVGEVDAVYSMITFQHINKEAVHSYISQVGERLLQGGIFRFQFVMGKYDNFLSHAVPLDEMKAWLDGAKMIVELVEQGIRYDTWCWITARRI